VRSLATTRCVSKSGLLQTMIAIGAGLRFDEFDGYPLMACR
jgi:hypothetical protein